MSKKSIAFISSGEVEDKIFLIRGQRVRIDRDLAELYGVGTKALNQAVNRNKERFPTKFMFRLIVEETKELVTNCDRFKSLKQKEQDAVSNLF